MGIMLYTILMHSLWQGLLLAAVTSLILYGTRRSSAAARYKWLMSALYTFSASMMVTLVIVATQAPVQPPANQLLPGLWELIGKQAPILSGLYLAIVACKTLGLASGLWKTQQLRREGLEETESIWQERVTQLAATLGIRKKVRIMQSALARVPLVAGHLKPLILVPAGLLSHLPPAEVEAIISHELAHIKRNDYLVNLLQTVLDILFFFNPAVLWINRLIREEREHCCDDLALHGSVGLHNYISALVSCQEYRQSGQYYSLAFAGSKKQPLKQRINRLVNPGNNNQPPAKGLLLILSVTALLFTAICCRRNSPADTGITAQPKSFNQADGKELHQLLTDDGLTTSNKNVSCTLSEKSLIVNGVPQPLGIQQKYVSRFVTTPGQQITYGYTYQKTTTTPQCN